MSKNKYFLRKFYILGILLLTYTQSFAVPAIPFQIEMVQPNGDQFKGYIRGDEWFNWRETLDGNVVIQNRDTGFFEFAAIKKETAREYLMPSGIVVTPELLSTKNGGKQGIPLINKQDLIRLWRGAIQNKNITK